MVKAVCNGQQEIVVLKSAHCGRKAREICKTWLWRQNEALRRSREIAEEEMGKITGVKPSLV